MHDMLARTPAEATLQQIVAAPISLSTSLIMRNKSCLGAERLLQHGSSPRRQMLDSLRHHARPSWRFAYKSLLPHHVLLKWPLTKMSSAA